MLSIFSHAGWPFRCLPWESVYLSSLPIFFLIRSFFFYVELYAYFGYSPFIGYIVDKYLLPFSRQRFCFTDNFLCCVKAFLA